MSSKDRNNGASILAWPGLQPGTRNGHGSHEPEAATPTPDDPPPEPAVTLTKTSLKAILGEITNLRQRQRATEMLVVMLASLLPQFNGFISMLDQMVAEADRMPSAADHRSYNQMLRDAAESAKVIRGDAIVAKPGQ